MLGTHNSGSFAKQIGWTKWIPKCFSRCQKLNLREQYDLGVRYFDIRVTYYKGDYYIAHGMVRYNLKLRDVMREISEFDEQCYVGVIVEDTFLKFHGDFGELVSVINEHDTVILNYMIRKKTGAIIYKNSLVSMQVAWLVPTAKKWDLHIPEIDCKDINRIFTKKQLIETNSINLVDFVETIQ